MNILNAVLAPNTNELILILSFGNVLQQPVPGVTELKGQPRWSSDNSAVKLEPIYNGINCRVTPPPAGPSVCVVHVEAEKMDGTKLEGNTAVEFRPTNEITGLVALPESGGIRYQKITP